MSKDFFNQSELMDIVTYTINNTHINDSPDTHIIEKVIEMSMEKVKNYGDNYTPDDLYESIISCFELYNQFIKSYNKNIPLVSGRKYIEIYCLFQNLDNE